MNPTFRFSPCTGNDLELSSPHLFNPEEHILFQSINNLSMKLQKDYASSTNPTKGNYIILKLENESIEYIEKINLNVLESILLETKTSSKSPENECSLVMTSVINMKKMKTFFPLNDMGSLINRIKEVLPRTYAEDACLRAQNMIEQCQKVFSQSKKAKLLKAFMALPITSIAQSMSNHSVKLNQQFFAELMQFFIFPLERFHDLFCSIYKSKIDIYISIYLVSILEHITQDILRLSINYVSYLKKYSISKRDVTTSIHAVHNLIKIANLEHSSQNDYDDDESDEKSENDEDDDDEMDDFGSTLGVSSQEIECLDSISLNSLSITNTNFSRKLKNEASSNEDGISDSSTICAESSSIENQNFKYLQKVNEFLLEHNQHLTDLNILRRIFMYLFQKFTPEADNDLIEKIFGNINDVYECALRLSDLIDDSTDSAESNETQPLQTVGQYFWELCEGAEFDEYMKFSFYVTNYKEVVTSINKILNSDDVVTKLEKTNTGLPLICKYLLPKLLLGSLYHILYVYETIEALLLLSTDEEDKSFLSNSLDTLKPIKYHLNKNGFVSSKQRPIEMSFRIFQPHQLQSGSSSSKTNQNYENKNLTSLSVKSLNTISQKSINSLDSVMSQKSMALAHNINLLSQKKWSDLEKNVESLKLPPSVRSNLSNIRYSYLFEGSIKVAEYESMKKQKSKISKRYAFLFDGLLILLKKQSQLPSNQLKMFKFKKLIFLDKFFLADSGDDDSFEFSCSTNTGDKEVFSFSCQPSEKTDWLSMLCYSKYKLTIERLLQTLVEEQNKNTPLPKPPNEYIFDQPDSPENILFEQYSGHQRIASIDQDDEALQRSPETLEALSIKAATLVKLVERLTHHLYLQPKLSSTFLMFFREFCTPRQLLDLLSKRFNVPDLSIERIRQLNYDFKNGDITERELLKRYRREYQEPIRLKVINFVKRWIEGYFEEDFGCDQELINSLSSLIDHMVKTNKRFGQLPLKSFQRKLSSISLQGVSKQESQEPLINDDLDNLKNVFKSTYSSTSSSSNSSRSSSVSENNQRSSPVSVEENCFNFETFPAFETHLESQYPYDILTIHPLEFARQATLMEMEIFKEIKSNELTCLGWKKSEKKYKLSPNVTKLINLTNKFTYWYAKCIIDTQNLEERVAVVQRLLDISNYFYQMNNFNGMREIYGAFGTSAVHRLHITKQKSGLETHKVYLRFKQLFDDHESGYMDRLKKCSPPCLPFIGKHLELIFKKHECNKLNSENHRMQITNEQRVRMEKLSATFTKKAEDEPGLINFSKYRLLIEFVSNLLQYQNVKYQFRINERIRSFILDDIENYIEEAKRSSKQDVEYNNVSSNSLQDTIDGWLHEKSKKIEPFDVDKFPRIRNYPLKSPLPSNSHPTSLSIGSIIRPPGASNKNSPHINSESRSHSTTRLEKQKKSPEVKVNQNQRSNPRSQTKELKKISKDVSNKSDDSESARIPLASASVSAMGNSSGSLIAFPSVNFGSVSSNGPPFNLSASSSKLEDSQISLNSTSSSLLYSIVNSPKTQKLSLSSADSSSSAPNSPPPNYDEVFDPNNSVLFSQIQFNHYQLSTETNLNNVNQKKIMAPISATGVSSCSSISANYPNRNEGQNKGANPSVFAFPEISSLSVDKMEKKIDERKRQKSWSPPPPPFIPPSPPTEPPPVIRTNKPTLTKPKNLPTGAER